MLPDGTYKSAGIRGIKNDKGLFTYCVISKGRGFRNDYANVFFALSNANFDYGMGRGSRNRQKLVT